MNLGSVYPCGEGQPYKVLARMQPARQRNDSSLLFSSYGAVSVLLGSFVGCKVQETSITGSSTEGSQAGWALGL